MARFIRGSLTRMLGVQASVGSVAVDLLRREIGLYGFRVFQPSRFGQGTLLYVPEIEGIIRMRSFFSGKLEIVEMKMAKIELDVRTDADGRNSLEDLADAISERRTKNNATVETWNGPIKSICVRFLSATDGSMFFRENTEAKDSLDITIVDIEVNASELRWGHHPDIETVRHGFVMVTGRLRQRPFPDGRGGVVIDIGGLNGKSTPIESLWRFIGIEFVSIAPLLPEDTASVLGGNAADMCVDISVGNGLLTGEAVIETLAGYSYKVMLSGTLNEPVLTTDSDAITYILSRTRGGAANFFRNVRWAGRGAGGAVVDAATDLAAGTIKTVGSFGSGLLQTAKGIVTFNSTEIRRGTKAMGVALVGGTTDAVFGTGGEIVEGAGEISHSLVGGEAADQWRNAIPLRWTNVWREAVETVEYAAPFPGQVSDEERSWRKN